ncbi:non-homologous end-joining DNA ligase [Gorillibacterium timonense]|uniref:non-homologous end-joining DNA ligase n=1 Tax=Gorillibacterium timonense TaxID=1689269 RepID=UPI00071D9946|nr:non-homologous end-joining DNA ligase [Gorillibacterium timonense]
MKQAAKGTVLIDGQELIITNPEKILWPELGITKLEYLQHLMELSPYLLAHCQDRYLTTIRYPHGIHGKSFYQKNAPEPVPPFVRTAVFQDIRYVVLDSLPTLLWLGNLACLEFHASFHRVDDDLPAEWVLDIDPSLDEEPRIMQAISLIGEALDKMRILAVPKTSGATGVQLVIPIRRGYTFEDLRRAGEFIGRYLTERYPQLFTIERLKKNRGDRIYVDYLQHWHGKTLSAPYTPRARTAASVSTPLLWSEVEAGVDPRDFHLRNLKQRLDLHGDLLLQVQPQSLDHVLSFL